MIRVFIADDQLLIRQGIRTLLEMDAEIVIAGEAEDGPAVRMDGGDEGGEDGSEGGGVRSRHGPSILPTSFDHGARARGPAHIPASAAGRATVAEGARSAHTRAPLRPRMRQNSASQETLIFRSWATCGPLRPPLVAVP